MKSIQLSDQEAILLHKDPTGLKDILETKWGKDFFEPKKITDRVKTVEDACLILRKDYGVFMAFCSKLSPSTSALEQSCLVIEALNEGWVPDYDDEDEQKWYIWWNMKKSANNPAGFGLYGPGFEYSYTNAGSRLSFRTRELAIYFAQQFAEVAKPFFKP